MSFREIFCGLTLLFFGFLTNHGFAEESGKEPFQPSEDYLADVDATLDKARMEEKLALIVMGANWCHDSRGLVEHFGDPELVATLEQGYETILVDVGLLERGRELISRFGMPVIYGTPTVLIVEPDTGRLLNKSSMFRWRDSASIPVEEAREYFSGMTEPAKWDPGAEPAGSPQLAALYAEIDAFEAVQAERIYKGFEVVGPMLGVDADERPENFLDYWKQLSALRYAITDDLARLRAEAKERVAAGEENIQLEFPEYEKFSWE